MKRPGLGIPHYCSFAYTSHSCIAIVDEVSKLSILVAELTAHQEKILRKAVSIPTKRTTSEKLITNHRRTLIEILTIPPKMQRQLLFT